MIMLAVSPSVPDAMPMHHVAIVHLSWPIMAPERP